MIHVNKFSCYDIDHLNEALTGTELENYQLSKGAFSGSISHIDLGKTILDTGTYSKKILAKGAFPQENITFAAILEAGDGKSLLRSKELKENTMLCLSENSEMSYIAAANSRWTTFQVTREELEIMGFEIKTLVDTTINQSSQQAQRTSKDIQNLLRELHTFTASELIHLNEAIIYDRVLAAYLRGFRENNKLIKLDRVTVKSVASEVYEYISSNPNCAITMHELCSVTGKSERTLQRSFKAHYNITLSDFIKTHRLHQVRRELNQPHTFTNTTQVALNHGFSHLSRFSQEYKKLFGESPVVTMKKNSINLS